MRWLSLSLCLLSLGAPAVANVPAAFNACEGAREMDPCTTPGPNRGACVLDTLCTDDPATEVNECLLCQDPCWATAEPGGPCIQITGEPGVCALQERCTDRPETSFVECNRCVPGEVPRTQPQAGCAARPGPGGRWEALGLPGLLGLLVLSATRRRRRGAGG